MRLFLQSGIKQPTLQWLNQCCMYLRVFLLSDIVSGTGECLLLQFWEHQRLVDTHLDWPTTPPPSPQSWNMWKQALTQVLHLGRHQRLAIPLGRWYMNSSAHGWFYHRQTNSLWQNDETLWQRHGGIPQRMWQQGFHRIGDEDTPPPLTKLEKATTMLIGQKLVLTSSSPCETPSHGIDPCHQIRIDPFATTWKLKLSLVGSQ